MHKVMPVRLFRGFSTYSSGTRSRSISGFNEITKSNPECAFYSIQYLICQFFVNFVIFIYYV